MAEIGVADKLFGAFRNKTAQPPLPPIPDVQRHLYGELKSEPMPPIVEKTPEQKLQEKCLQVIDTLDQKNTESLEAGNSRIGYQVGTDEHRVFVLAQPIDIDTPDKNEDSGEEFVRRIRNYVVFTPEGARTIFFNKGALDDNGNIRVEFEGSGLTFDARYEGGEPTFLQELHTHTIEHEDDNGRKIDTIYPATDTAPENRRKYDSLKKLGYFREKDGVEIIQVGDDYRPRPWMTASKKDRVFGVSEASQEVVDQALEKSIEAAKKPREIKPTHIEQQQKTVDSVLAKLGK